MNYQDLPAVPEVSPEMECEGLSDVRVKSGFAERCKACCRSTFQFIYNNKLLMFVGTVATILGLVLIISASVDKPRPNNETSSDIERQTSKPVAPQTEDTTAKALSVGSLEDEKTLNTASDSPSSMTLDELMALGYESLLGDIHPSFRCLIRSEQKGTLKARSQSWLASLALPKKETFSNSTLEAEFTIWKESTVTWRILTTLLSVNVFEVDNLGEFVADVNNAAALRPGVHEVTECTGMGRKVKRYVFETDRDEDGKWDESGGWCHTWELDEMCGNYQPIIAETTAMHNCILENQGNNIWMAHHCAIDKDGFLIGEIARHDIVDGNMILGPGVGAKVFDAELKNTSYAMIEMAPLYPGIEDTISRQHLIASAVNSHNDASQRLQLTLPNLNNASFDIELFSTTNTTMRAFHQELLESKTSEQLTRPPTLCTKGEYSDVLKSLQRTYSSD